MKHRLFYLGLVLLALSLACGDKKILDPSDRTPPAAIQDLTSTPLGTTSIELSWTATGDDGKKGTASSFDLRMNRSPISMTSFDSSLALPSPPEPLPAGGPHTYYLAGLEEGTAYYFALKASDDIPNISKISNVANVSTAAGPDTIPPAAITDLTVASVAASRVTLTWTAPGDDRTFGNASGYDLRFAHEAITTTTWETAKRLENLPSPEAQGSHEEYDAEGFERDEMIYFALRALDERRNSSSVSNVPMATMPPMPRTWFVRADGFGDAPTIQSAIDSSHSGDEVLVGSGTYFENIDFMGKGIRLKSAQGPDVTILNGSRAFAPVVSLTHSEGPGAIVEGFTITGGTGHPRGGSPWGGGIYAPGVSAKIRGNRIVRNETMVGYGSGGGITIWGPAGADETLYAIVEDNLLEDNRAFANGGGIQGAERLIVRRNIFRGNTTEIGDGGALYLHAGAAAASVSDNEFWNNRAGDHGGGVYVNAYVQPVRIERNLFVRNEAHAVAELESGGGAAISARIFSGWIMNNTIVGNTSAGQWECTGGGIFLANLDGRFIEISNNIISGNLGCGLSCYAYNPSVTFRHNILWGNNPADFGYGRAQCPPNLREENLLVDPEFCSPETDDYHLRAGSPALAGEEAIGAYDEPGCSEVPAGVAIRSRFRSPR